MEEGAEGPGHEASCGLDLTWLPAGRERIAMHVPRGGGVGVFGMLVVATVVGHGDGGWTARVARR